MVEWDDKTKASGGQASDTQVQSVEKDRAYLIVLAGNNVGEMYKVTEAMVIGRGQNAQIHKITDEGISRRHAQIVVSGDSILIEDLGSTNGTFLNGQKVALQQSLKDGDKIQVGSTTILKFTYHDRLEEHFQRQMYESALRDGLTKVFNKKYFLDRLESEFAYAMRHKVPLSLLMFDLDHFKRINDSYGHLAGDFVLVQLARIVSESIRGEDVFARYGGEEFVVVCRGIDLNSAQAFAERIRRTIEEFEFRFEEIRVPVTISIGIAALPASDIKDSTGFIAAADEVLYEAKRNGRNRTVARKPK